MLVPFDKLGGVRADAAKDNLLYLIKNCSTLRATYQIRALLYHAKTSNKKLVLDIPEDCILSPCLQELRSDNPNTLVIQRS
jgi:hypothetical protein